MIMKLNLLIIVALLFSAQQVISQEWLVPAEKQNVKNPSEFNLENVKKGKEIYMRECKSCHGDPGKYNGLALIPPPPDVTSEIMQDNTDGELFYKISSGKGVMPSFEAVLPEEDRWLLVNFIKNFNPEITPLLVEAPPVKANLTASIDEANRVVTVFAEFQNKKGNKEALVETPVDICVERAFGNLPIGQVLTDEKGNATFTLPEKIIGDEEGYINVIVTLREGFEAEKVALGKTKLGIPKETPQLIKKGVIWSTNENIPMWMLLSYLAAIGGAWITIGYVVFQIYKIGRLSKE